LLALLDSGLQLLNVVPHLVCSIHRDTLLDQKTPICLLARRLLDLRKLHREHVCLRLGQRQGRLEPRPLRLQQGQRLHDSCQSHLKLVGVLFGTSLFVHSTPFVAQLVEYTNSALRLHRCAAQRCLLLRL